MLLLRRDSSWVFPRNVCVTPIIAVLWQEGRNPTNVKRMPPNKVFRRWILWHLNKWSEDGGVTNFYLAKTCKPVTNFTLHLQENPISFCWLVWAVYLSMGNVHRSHSMQIHHRACSRNRFSGMHVSLCCCLKGCLHWERRKRVSNKKFTFFQNSACSELLDQRNVVIKKNPIQGEVVYPTPTPIRTQLLGCRARGEWDSEELAQTRDCEELRSPLPRDLRANLVRYVL